MEPTPEFTVIESIDLPELAGVTGGRAINSAQSLLQYIRDSQKGGSVLRPPNPPNLEGSLTGEFRRDLGTWPRFANPGSAGTGYIRNPLLTPHLSPFRNHF